MDEVSRFMYGRSVQKPHSANDDAQMPSNHNIARSCQRLSRSASRRWGWVRGSIKSAPVMYCGSRASNANQNRRRWKRVQKGLLCDLCTNPSINYLGDCDIIFVKLKMMLFSCYELPPPGVYSFPVPGVIFPVFGSFFIPVLFTVFPSPGKDLVFVPDGISPLSFPLPFLPLFRGQLHPPRFVRVSVLFITLL